MDQVLQELRATALSKRYGHTQALDSVSLTLTSGRVHGLVGHNGAGKSTLLRMLSGAERPDSGEILLDGVPLHASSPREAIERGISCVYQELSLVDELTVAQNVFLGRELRRGGRLALAEMERETGTYLAEYGLPVSPTVKVRTLTVAQRQLVEVITALHRNVRFLLLDEPTTALEVSQVEQLLEAIKRVAQERDIAVLLVDHKIDEVFVVAHEVTVLRNGIVVLSGPVGPVGRADVVDAIVGDEASIGERTPVLEEAKVEEHRVAIVGLPRPVVGPGAAVAPSAQDALAIRGMRSEALRDVSLTVRSGRVLGIYGLVGSGRTNMLRSLYGVEPCTATELLLFGRPYRPRNPGDAIAAGIAYLPEERKFDGFIPLFTPISNATLPVLRRFEKWGLLRLGNAAAEARTALGSVDVKGDIEAPMSELSGGNQQKVLFGRVVVQRPRLLLLDEPTKGVDIRAKREIHRIIRSLVAGVDIAAIVVSSEEEEILDVADDVAVFRRGVCDGTTWPPADLAPGDLRRLAWVSAALATTA